MISVNLSGSGFGDVADITPARRVTDTPVTVEHPARRFPVRRQLSVLRRGLATRAQLTAGGLGRPALQWRLGRTWRAVLPGVVTTFAGVLDPVQRWIAAQLSAGPEAV